MNIFYSWQSDLESKYNRNFIKNCIAKAITKINKGLILEEPLRIDHDTKDIPGSPDIVDTILNKIDDSTIFIGDISFIGKTSTGRYCSNPNVLIELGYALKQLSDSCIINVMNTSQGKPDENMPFDLSHKRYPIQYDLNEHNSSKIPSIKKQLIKDLIIAIELIIKIRIPINDPVPIVENPSIANIKNHILFSNPKVDWEGLSVDSKSYTIYQNDANLRIEIKYVDEGIHQNKFVDDWANKFLHSDARSYWCDIFYGSSLIDRTYLVSVDDGNAMLPSPKKQDHNGNYTIVEAFDYKIAEIFDLLRNLDYYFQQTGFEIEA